VTVLVIDLIIVGATVWLAMRGFSNGLTVATLTLAGLGVGAVVGSRLAPLVLEGGVHSTYAPIVALPGALLVGALAAAALERFGFRRRRELKRLGAAGSAGGALLAGCLGLVLAWTLGAVVKQLGASVEGSAVLERLNAVLPPPGPVVAAEAESPGPFPRFEGPPPQVRRADPLVARDPDVQSAGRSVVRIAAISCGHPGSGSGWVAAEGIVATAAHVVAGADVVTIRDRGRKSRAQQATLIWLDRTNDLALLRSPGARRVDPLPLVPEPKRGISAAMLGFPGGRWTIKPARLGRTAPATVRFRRRERRLDRSVTLFLGRPEPGNSGGPLVDTRGRVLTTLFAGDAKGRSGVGVPNAVVDSALARAGPPVDSGPCEGH
jgi:Trypsin-like peptidase domain/Colicin V production protein